MNRTHTILAVLTALSLASCGMQAPPPGAAQPTVNAQALLERVQASPDPEAALAALSPEAREQLRPLLTLERWEQDKVPAVLTPQAVGCFSNLTTFTGKSAANVTLLRLYQRLNTCSNGRYFTSASKEQWFEVYAIGWRFVGYTDSSKSGGVGWNYFRGVTQAQFVLGIGGWDLQNSYPRLDYTVYP